MDAQEGREPGTWFGVNPATGRIAVLLNVLMPTEEVRNDAKGRGTLVVEALSPENEPVAFLNALSDVSDDYNGFKLIIFEPNA
jgi:uncharacterized protein with NRDE domain